MSVYNKKISKVVSSLSILTWIQE